MAEQLYLPEIRETGFDEVIIYHTSQGKKPGEIEEIVLNEFNIKIDSRTIGRYLAQFGDTNDFVRAQDAKALAERRKEARQTRNHFRDKYHAAEGDEDLDRMKFFAQEFKDWWDREGKLFLSHDEVPSMFQQNNFTQVNPVQVVVDELGDDPDKLRRVLERIGG